MTQEIGRSLVDAIGPGALKFFRSSLYGQASAKRCGNERGYHHIRHQQYLSLGIADPGLLTYCLG